MLVLCTCVARVSKKSERQDSLERAFIWPLVGRALRAIFRTLLPHLRLPSIFRRSSYSFPLFPKTSRRFNISLTGKHRVRGSQVAICKIDLQVRDLHLRYSNCLKPTHGAILDRTTFEYNTVDYPSCVAASCRRCSRTILPFLGIATSRKHCPIFF